jgi:hypothetical protein
VDRVVVGGVVSGVVGEVARGYGRTVAVPSK